MADSSGSFFAVEELLSIDAGGKITMKYQTTNPV